MERKPDLICLGTALVDSILKGFDPTPVSASGYRAVSGSLHVGGEAVNASMAAAKLGTPTAIFCTLGRDAAGDLVVGALERCGVDTRLVIRDADHPTPVTTMFVRDDGGRQSITNEAHRYNFHPERWPERLDGAKALLLGSLFRAPFDEPGVFLSVVKAAKERGMLVVADTKLPNFRRLLLRDFRAALPLVDYLTPNEDEAWFCTAQDAPEDQAKALLDYGVKNVVLKLGPRGCYFANASEKLSLPACKIDPVDATGAGDNFVAGFVSELLRGASHAEALRFANACGALCTTALGASAGLRDRAQVLSFLEAQKSEVCE